jgi:hypothetical protein
MSRILVRSALTICLAFGVAFVDENSALAKPVEYVKVCSLYGQGFYYIPGTDTCLKVGGFARNARQVGEGKVCNDRYFTSSGAACSRDPGPDVQYVKVCSLYGRGFYYIPGTDTCLNLNDTQRHAPSTSNTWIGGGLGFTTTDNRVTTIYQRTFNVFDALSGYNSAGLASTGFRGDIDFGWDTVLGNWPNWPNLGWGMPMTLGVAGSFGYSDTDQRVGRIPGSELFTANGPGTDYFRVQGGFNGSIGGRLGMYVTPSLLVYGSGGYAFQDFKATINCGTGLCGQNGIPQTTLTQSQWRSGYYFGGGFMMPLPNADGWTAGLELRETDYGDWTVTQGNPALYEGQFKVHLSEFSAMLRLHRNFGASETKYLSDVRVKRDIALLGHLDNGLGIYSYRYLWSDQRYVGVMAQEVALVRADAVEHGADGYLRVNYARLGLHLQTWDEWKATH